MKFPDADLLKAFARHRNEAAFQQLAKRYLGLIFHTALRRTGNRALSEEISQNVLCALAKKAGSLATHPDRLPGWLHRATLFESSKAMRSESSHQRRSQLQEVMVGPSDPAGNEAWRQALPHLDKALDALSESDRRVLLLHFFDNLSFPKIAGLLGKSSAAVQKQSVRALEKMSRLMRSKGFTVSVTTLGAGLTTEFAKAAPTGLLTGATASALTASSGFSTTSTMAFMLTTHSKVIILCSLLLLAIPLALQQIAISELRRENQTLVHRSSARDSSRPNSESLRGSSMLPTLSSSMDILVLAEESDAAKWGGELMQIAFRQKLAAIPADRLAGLIGETAEVRLALQTKGGLLENLVSALSSNDPGLAVRSIITAIQDSPAFSNLLGQAKVERSFSEWVCQDPEAATNWFKTLEKSPRFNPPEQTGPRDVARGNIGEFRPLLFQGLVLLGSPLARDYVAGISAEEGASLVLQSIEKLSKTPAYREETPAIYLPLIREIEDDAKRELALSTLATSLCYSVSSLGEVWKQSNFTEKEKHSMAVSVATRSLSTSRMGKEPGMPFTTGPLPEEAREVDAWIDQMFPQEAEPLRQSVRASLVEHQDRLAKQNLRTLQSSIQNMRDNDLVGYLTRVPYRDDLEEALKFAEKIGDDEKRKATIKAIEEAAQR
jgi:RNA polymerase sigma factor (sigma-70 family)